MRTAVVFTVLALAAAACEPRHHHRPPQQVPSGDEWRVPTDAADGGAPAKPAPSAQPASGDEIHI